MIIVNQVMGDSAIHYPATGLYLNKVKTLLKKFEKYKITQVQRGENSHVDALASIASTVDYFLQ